MARQPRHQLRCQCCGLLFPAVNISAKWCGNACRQWAFHERKRAVALMATTSSQVVQPEILEDDPNDLPLSWRQAAAAMELEAQRAAPLAPFAYEGRQVRVITDEQGMPWFVAADVCSTLGIGNVSQALSRLDADEKTLISNEGAPAGGPQSLNLINESGLYSLILGSRKPEARAFKRWVTHEVLPAIRKTGRYELRPEPQPTPITAERITAVLATCDPITTNTVLKSIGMPCSRSNQMAVGSILRGLGYQRTRATADNCRIWVYQPAAPVPQHQPLPLTEGIHVVAATRRRAAEIWYEAIKREVAGAVAGRFSPNYRSDATVPRGSYHWRQLSLVS